MTTEVSIDLSVAGVMYKGEPGDDGANAYQVWLNAGNVGTEADYFASLKGDDGKSAYDVWIANGGVGTEAQYLASLKGDAGKSAYQIWLDAGNTGSEAVYLASLKGANGKSAYQVWLELGNTGTEQEYQDSLKGEDGKDGTGLTNRQAWVTGSTYSPGDYVFADNANGDNSMWILSGTADYVSTIAPKDDLSHWIEFQAPAGADGKNTEMQATATYIQWRVVGASTWINLVALADLKGVKGDTGNTMWPVSAVPAASLGVNGDFANDVTNSIMYGPKAAGAWPAGVSYKGAKGDSVTGAAGRGIASATMAYQAATSGTVAPTGTWTTTIPAVTKGQYLWSRTTLTYTDATTTVAYSVAYQGVDGTSGGGSGTSVLVLTAAPTSTDGADGSIAMVKTSNGYISAWSRAGTVWTKQWEMSLSVTAENIAATDSTKPTTPAGVREYLEPFGLTATYTTTPTDMNSVVKGGFFNWSSTTLNLPLTGSYGRGLCIPAGTGYVTQIGWVNDTGACYIRFFTNSVWGAWLPLGGSSSIPIATATVLGGVKIGSGVTVATDGTISVASSGGGGAANPAGVQAADISLNKTTATKLGLAGTVLPVLGMVYQFKAIILTQGTAAQAATFTARFSDGFMGVQIFRGAAVSPNAAGVFASSVSDQSSLAVSCCNGPLQNGVTIFEGVIQFNYMGTVFPDIELLLVTGDYMNILKGGSLTFTPVATLAM